MSSKRRISAPASNGRTVVDVVPDESAEAIPSWSVTLRELLPRGGTLSEGAWAGRHRAILVLIWLHIPALGAFGLIRGLDPQHVVAETAILLFAALLAGTTAFDRLVRMGAASFGLASASAILVHFSGGYIEMHFHFFVVVVIVSLYQHWLPFLGTIAYVAIHHGVLGALDPASVFNHPDAIAHPWKWAAIHAGFILSESVAAIYLWRHSESAQLATEAVARNLASEQEQLVDRTAALALLEGAASAANEASDVGEAVEAVLAAVCAHTGWPIGHAFLVADDRGELIDTGIWHCEHQDLRAFQRSSQELRGVSGPGLVGRVIERGKALSIPDLAADPGFFRKEAAAEAGLVSAFAFPLLAGSEVAGVLEFFAATPHTLGDDLLHLMEQVGAQLGRVIERRRATEALRSGEERIRSIVETASDAFVGMDDGAVVTDWNRRAETMFGWTAEEAIGRRAADLILPARHHDEVTSSFSADAQRRRIEVTALHRDGHEFPVELTVWATSSGGRTNFNAFVQDISERARNRAELEQAYATVSEAVQGLERRNREVTLVGEMGELLQTCETVEEVYEIAARYAGRLFSGHSGAVYVLAASRDTVEAVALWGGTLRHDEAVFAPGACWALRRGRPHEVTAGDGLTCAHVSDGAGLQTLCIPMVAQSDALGIVHFRSGATAGEAASWSDEGTRRLAVAVAEHVALALANFRLRAKLRAQSIRDPLTGLYNRRYLEESFERELRRAERSGRQLSVVSIDVDHFKIFNDTFGHGAGDAVLASVGRLLLEHVRGEDIACRMGGEELLMVLPECPEDVAVQRAEALRNLVRRLTVDYEGQRLGMITVSLGVATFPEHGKTVESLLRAADDALYRAKAEGRDRTLVHAAS